ncbi:MAG: type 4a pilus biogenesis protein PilO [bacterium]|nr:pilus assembly protein PilO [Deltaproteobacteria bacterium]MCP4906678.1 type 4a pilus biogenesis protein PilO [bacterium]
MALDFDIDFDGKLEQLAKAPKANRLAVVSALLMSIAVGYWYLSYQPAQEALQTYVLKAHGLQRNLNNARTVANNLPGFEAEVASLQRDLDLALKQLPNRKQFEDLLQDISTAGKKVGVSIKSIDRDQEVNRDFYAEVPFKLEIEGSYHDLARFFEMVASLPRIVNVGALDIKVASENQLATQLKVSGRATTFRFLSDGA